MTCAGRAAFLKSKYGTADPEEATMKSRPNCRNPPLQIYWQDDEVDELDNVFSQPRPVRGNLQSRCESFDMPLRARHFYLRGRSGGKVSGAG